MTPNPALTDKEIASLLLYVNSVAGGGEIAGAGKADPLAIKGKSFFSPKPVLHAMILNLKQSGWPGSDRSC